MAASDKASQEPHLLLQHGRGSPCLPLVLSAASQALLMGSCFLPSLLFAQVVPNKLPALCAHQSAPTPRTHPEDSEHGEPVTPTPEHLEAAVSRFSHDTNHVEWDTQNYWSSHGHTGQIFASHSRNLCFSAFGFGSCRLGTLGLLSSSVDTLLFGDHITSREERHLKQWMEGLQAEHRESLHRTASSSG